MDQESFYTKNAIIPQPPIENVLKVETSFLLINSRDRNLSEYPSSSSYVIPLEDDYRDILSIELLNYDVPNNTPTISSYNNVLHYSIEYPSLHLRDGKQVVIDYHKQMLSELVVPMGNYDISPMSDNLSIILEDLLNGLQLSTFKVNWNPATQKYTICTDFSNRSNPQDDLCFFQLFFKGTDNQYLPKSIGKFLGFAKQDIDTLVQGVVYTNGSKPCILSGIHSFFDQELLPNDWVFIQEIEDPSKRYRAQVVDILEKDEVRLDRHLTITKAMMWVGRFESKWIRDIYTNSYLLLKVNDYEIVTDPYRSNPCFSIIPIRKFNFETRDSLQSVKMFPNLLPRLSRLEISFWDEYGNLYDFQGLDHVLVFRIEYYQQNMNFVRMPFG
jgi:hypothetical protein